MLPESTYKAIYYIALITELCKSSPTTVGPAVGKSIRRLYALLADGLDVEVEDLVDVGHEEGLAGDVLGREHQRCVVDGDLQILDERRRFLGHSPHLLLYFSLSFFLVRITHT